MRPIWIAVGAGGALLAAVLAFTLLPTTPAETVNSKAPAAPRPKTVATAVKGSAASRPASGGVDTPAAKDAWLRARFGQDLNEADSEPGVGGPEPTVKVINVAARAPQPSPELSPPPTPEAAKAHFERDTSKMVEQFPDTKAFVDEMKAEIEMAQREARLNAERAEVQRRVEQQQ